MNAKEELIKHVADKEVAFVSIIFNKNIINDIIVIKGENIFVIKGKLEEVLSLLDFEYDNGYGGQELFGYIWYTDETWSERGEYDGSEWWEYKKRPDQDIDIIEKFYIG